MPPGIVSIFVATPPSKTVYFEGQYFNTAGMVVKARLSNGTTQTIYTYFYNPQSALTTSNTFISISYQGFTTTQPITVNPALTISAFPNKLNYIVGESFDPTGTVVTYNSGGTPQVITNYSFSPSGALSLSNTSITISYNGFTTFIPIGVSSSTLVGPFPKQNLSNANLGNNPFYNLFDQSIRFITTPLMVNRDSYALSFNLTYYSRMRERLSNLIKGLPSRFKTNYHQYLLQDGVDASNRPIIKYFDADAYIHTFLYVTDNLYYAYQSKLYLTFYYENSVSLAKIIDGKGNELHFDSNGCLFKIVSNQGSNNVKRIVYSGDYISYIYDERDSTTRINYSYNNLNQLNEVSFIYKNSLIKKLSFTYTNKLLTLVSEIDASNNNSRNLYTYFYNYNHVNSSYDHVEYIKDHLSNSVYAFTYFYDLNYDDYIVDSFSSGLFIDGVFSAKEYLRRVSSELRNDCTTSQIILRNHNDLYFIYHLDKKALITASFEGDEYGSVLKTTYKESGVYLNINGSSSLSINTHAAKNITSSLSIVLDDAAINLLNKYKHFVLRMYVKINSDSLNRVKASISYSNITASLTDLNVEQTHKYQLIEIPFTCESNSISSATFVLSFKNENNTNVDVDIADLYLDKKERTLLVFDDGAHTFDEVSSLLLYDNFGDNVSETINVNLYPYFKESDFLETFFFKNNVVLSSLINSNLLFLMDGKAYSQYDDCFDGVDASNNLVINHSHLSNSDLDDSDAWYFLSKSIDDTVIKKTYYRFVATNNIAYQEIITRTIFNNDDSTLQEEIKRYELLTNRLVELTKTHIEDSNTVYSITTYTYFTNGELQSVTISNGSETINLYQATENNDGYVDSKTSGLNSVNIDYTGYLENSFYREKYEFDVTNIYRKSFIYDAYKDELLSVTHLINQTNKAKNTLLPDYLNCESSFKLNDNEYYKLTNNLLNDTSLLKRYDGSSFEDVLSYKKTPLLDEVTIYGNNANSTISETIDIYGKPTNIKENNVSKVTFTYDPNGVESLIVLKNIASVTDSYINKITTYSYNGFDYYEQSCLDDYFDVERLYNGDTKYGFGSNEAYKYKPLGEYLDITTANNTRLQNFSNKHTYDVFNRLVRKDRFINASSSQIFLSDIYAYKSNSLLYDTYQQRNLDNNLVREEYSYDEFGNLSNVSLTYRNWINENASSIFSGKIFQYDGFNRLIYETNTDSHMPSRSYSYNNQGRMVTFGNNQLTYNNKGQLSSFGSTTYNYDKYGNRIKKTVNNIDTNYSWVRGKLLSSITGNISYSYDYRGLRYQKDTNKETVTYYYDNNRLIGEDHVGKTYSNQTYPSFSLRFFYDNDGTLLGFRYINGQIVKDYIYIVNPFNEIIGLSLYEDNPSSLQCSLEAIYIYDAWGNHITYNGEGVIDNNELSIANINPFRYKSYYYDKESGLYYLLSRYYDPSIGQFISPDDYTYLDINRVSGYHLYAYCNNNPVMNVDPEGHVPVATWIGYAVGLSLYSFTGKLGIMALSYLGACIDSIYDERVRAGMVAANWNPFNADDKSVLSVMVGKNPSASVSFYKGVPVLESPLGRSGSIGAIFVDESDDYVALLKHEYGHTVQMQYLGVLRYMTRTFIQSWAMIGVVFEDGVAVNYYRKPWESSASMIGGDWEHDYSQKDITISVLYLLFAKHASLLWSYLFAIWG